MANILVIEDSSYIRSLIREILEADGHRVVETDNGLFALQMATQEASDCILLDLIMPNISGLNVLGNLREGGCKAPVLIITAHLQDSVREQCLELGAAGFINKPFFRDELREAVNKILGLTQELEK